MSRSAHLSLTIARVVLLMVVWSLLLLMIRVAITWAINHLPGLLPSLLAGRRVKKPRGGFLLWRVRASALGYCRLSNKNSVDS